MPRLGRAIGEADSNDTEYYLIKIHIGRRYRWYGSNGGGIRKARRFRTESDARVNINVMRKECGLQPGEGPVEVVYIGRE